MTIHQHNNTPTHNTPTWQYTNTTIHQHDKNQHNNTPMQQLQWSGVTCRRQNQIWRLRCLINIYGDHCQENIGASNDCNGTKMTLTLLQCLQLDSNINWIVVQQQSWVFGHDIFRSPCSKINKIHTSDAHPWFSIMALSLYYMACLECHQLRPPNKMVQLNPRAVPEKLCWIHGWSLN